VLTKAKSYVVMALHIPLRLDLVVTGSCLLLLGYVALHVYQGPRGVGYRDALLAEVRDLQGQLEAQTTERKRLDNRAKLLRPESVDPDMVEELARRDLALVYPNDRIILLSD
jgi:cell division protein FtsB